MKAIVNRLIPFSAVDGPGNRTKLSLQGCNLNCKHCHDPEIIHFCTLCGKCVEYCTTGALSWKNETITYDFEKCIQCDACIDICPNASSPKTQEMTVDELKNEIAKNIPFIRGITVSGGECTLQSAFLKKLFPQIKKLGLSILLDSNGTYDFELDNELLQMIDGVTVDIKAFDKEEHIRLTGFDNASILKNMEYLAKRGKLFEVRTAIIPGRFDYKKTVESVAKILQSYNEKKAIRYKLVSYWRNKQESKLFPSPDNQEMEDLKSCLESYGFTDIITKGGEPLEKQRNVDMDTVVIQMKDIVKKFGNFVANDGINLTVHKGEVHAILGENGAGKSTLMNVLYGLYHPTSGDILVGGEKVDIDSPKKAIELGIGMVHQHFMLVQPFTVTENIILGMEPRKGLTVDLKKAREEVKEISERYNLRVDVDAKVEDISVGMQQRVEILKVLYRGADILILDEPTASLTPQEIEELIEIIGNLTKDGKSVILITHKLKEIKASADYCTIIRRGKYINTVDVEEVDENELASMMVGRTVEFVVDKKELEPGEDVLVVKDLHGKDYRGIEILKGLNINVRKGEIVGIAGIDGNGQSELVEMITGLKKADAGEVTINGENIFNANPRTIFEKGVSSIPEDRQKHGLVLDFSVAENMILQNFGEETFSKKGVLKRGAISEFTNKLIEKFDIRPNDCENKLAGQLSGGNQQKVIIAREVTNNKDLLIAVNPTRGLDVGAIEFVHKYIVEQRNKNKAVLLVSFELDEIMSLSDRIDVIYDGKIVGEVKGKEADENTLGLLMAGGGVNHE